MKNEAATLGIRTVPLEEAARKAPNVSFIPDVPGIVKSGIMRDLEPSPRLSIVTSITRVLAPLIEITPEECAERPMFLVTSARYQSGKSIPLEAGR